MTHEIVDLTSTPLPEGEDDAFFIGQQQAERLLRPKPPKPAPAPEPPPAPRIEERQPRRRHSSPGFENDVLDFGIDSSPIIPLADEI